MDNELTEKQEEVLRAMLHFRDLEGYFPSLRELAEIFECSLGNIQSHLEHIENKCWIARIKGTQRAFKILRYPTPKEPAA